MCDSRSMISGNADGRRERADKRGNKNQNSENTPLTPTAIVMTHRDKDNGVGTNMGKAPHLGF